MSDSTAEEALARAQRGSGLEDLTFIREADSEVWVAGGSSNPTAVVELSQADGNPEWFISSVTTCSAAKGVDGSEATSGVPHRVLVEGVDVGDVFATDVAGGDDELQALWSRLGLTGAVPDVDLKSSVVLYFGAVESGSCPLGEVQALVLDEMNARLYPEIPLAHPDAEVCTDDANRHAVLLAVDRDDLPREAFSLWIDEADPPACCADGETFIGAGELAPM
ncbi:hypothetical protein BH20ACT1_BH20ACT1_02290 [soil metagenome]